MAMFVSLTCALVNRVYITFERIFSFQIADFIEVILFSLTVHDEMSVKMISHCQILGINLKR